MNFFGGSKRANANANAKKPIVRKETVLVPVKKPVIHGGVQKQTTSSARPPANRFQLSRRSSDPRLKPTATVAKKTPLAPAQRALAVSRGQKRKAATPDRIEFSSEDEDGSSEVGASDSDASRKRIKSSVSSVESGGLRRNLVLEAAFEKEVTIDFLHGADATSGDYVAKFKNPWSQSDFFEVELKYPSRSQRERFELKWPKNEKDDYQPMSDIIETVDHIAQFYFPDDLNEKYTSEENGFRRQFNRAWQRQSIPEFISIAEDFNRILTSLLENGTIKRELASQRHLPLTIVKRIMEQIYSRTVSPKVESLRAYENGTDNVYGELLARFCSSIFKQTKLNHEQVIVDLGSGVGNVVLQAALEIGCESWGIEMMKNPCDLADLQAKEFPGRSRLWGINVGAVRLIRGDFTNNAEIAPVLKRADVVLVNNQAFTPALNDTLLSMFLDLKDGCQVVSLKPFVPEGHKISMRNIGSVANLFVQKRYEYFSESVSWTDQGGFFYIATKDRRPLDEFGRKHGGR